MGISSNESVVTMTDIVMDNLNTFNSAIAKADFKEKLGRMLQYGARMISGILTDADKLSPSKDRQQLIAKVRSRLRMWPYSLDKLVPVSTR